MIKKNTLLISPLFDVIVQDLPNGFFFCDNNVHFYTFAKNTKQNNLKIIRKT